MTRMEHKQYIYNDLFKLGLNNLYMCDTKINLHIEKISQGKNIYRNV